MSRPQNWYSMTYDQQREWQRREDELRYERDERDRDRAAAESLDQERQRTIRAARSELAGLREECWEQSERARHAENFIRAKDLWEEFEACALGARGN